MIFFWVVVLFILGIVGALAWWGIGVTIAAQHRSAVRSALIIFDVISAILLLAGRQLVWIPEPVMKYGMLIFTAIWMAELFFGVITLVARALRRGLSREGMHAKDVPSDPERRKLIKGALALPVAAATASAYGTAIERTHTVVREFDVPVEGLGSAVEGFRIAQLSDVHLGLFFSLKDLRGLLERAAETKADALVITGDLFDDNDINEDAAALIDTFCDKFPKGIWFCYGNHEYFRNIEKTKKALGKTRIHVLTNDSARVLSDTRPLYFSGVDYPRLRPRFEELEKEFMRMTMQGVPRNAVTVLLAHHPDFIDDAAEYDVTLALTGHTHGGQLGIFGVPIVPPVFKYLRGKYIVGKCFGYVHSGNGSWFPFRFGCPPEIPVFRLTSAN